MAAAQHRASTSRRSGARWYRQASESARIGRFLIGVGNSDCLYLSQFDIGGRRSINISPGFWNVNLVVTGSDLATPVRSIIESNKTTGYLSFWGRLPKTSTSER